MLLVALVATLVCASSASAAVTQKQAASRAIDAFGSDAGSGAVIVFGLPKALKAGTKIMQAGTTKPGTGSTKGLSSKLRSAGVRTVKAPKVLSVRTRSFFFYEDRGPFMLYQHPGRVAIVDVATGKVTLSRTINWPPLINGRLPAFLKSANAYRSSKYQVFNRPWVVQGATQQRRQPRNQFENDPFGPGKPLPSLANSKTIANRLAAEGSCVLRVTDTLPTFWNVNELNLTRSYVGTLFEQLERDNPAFVDDRYGARSGETLGEAIDRLVKAGCKDILLYIAGQGYSSAGEPVIHLGTSVRSGGLIAQQNLSATDLRTLVQARPGVTFKFKFDAPYSGGMVDRLRDLANVLLVETPAAAGDEAWAFIPQVENESGQMVTQTANPAGLLEFTNCELIGLKAFFDSASEIDKATQGQNEGVSFLAEMLARSQELCNGNGGWADDVGAAPQLYAQKRASGAGTNRPPKADKQDVTVVEDTPTNITLTGSDPDGDSLTFSITKQPDHGDLSGTPPNVTYTPDPDYVGPDDFSFKVDDGKGASNTAKVDITVVEGNDPPVVTTSAGNTAYTEGAALTVVDGALTVSDPDDTQLESATVRIHEDDFQTDDVLDFIPQLGITGFYDTGTGILTLTGTASVSDYQTALRDVRFRTSNDNPKTPKRILFAADDGDGLGPTATKNIAITGVDDPPVVDASDFNLAYTEGDGPVPADQFISVTDPDSDNITGATIDAADATWIPAEDALAFADNDTGDGITLGSYNDSTGTLTLTGTGTVGQYQAAIQAVTYENSSDNPTTTNRTISFQVADGATNSNTDTRDIEITRTNDAPVLANGGTMNYTENGAAAAISSTITASDVDDTQLEGATITITTGAENTTDDLSWSDNNGADSISLDSDDNSTDTLTLVGPGTMAEYEAALRAVEFSSTSDNPATSKTVAFTATDGEDTSAPENATVNITRVNDNPVLDATDAALAYSEGTGAQAVDNGITVSDVDSANLVGATIDADAAWVPAEDELAFVDNNTGDGITQGSYNDGTGVLTLTGTGTLAEYQAAIRAVTYTNSSDNPSTATRGITFQVDDGGAVDNLSNIETRNINITPSNDAPSVSNAGTLNYTENDPATQISNTLTVSDPDDTNLESATAELTGNPETGDQLDWTDNNLADSITEGASTATKIVLTGTGTLAEYQAALRAITFESTNNHPATSKTVTYIVNDGDVNSGGHTATINVTRVNDKPVVSMTNTALTYSEGSGDQQIDGNVTLTDPENDQISGATVDADDASWVPANDQLTFTDTDTGDGITLGTYNDSTGTLTLTGTASLAAYEAALEDVKYSNNSDNPSGSRTISMTVTDAGTPNETSDPDSRTINFTASNDAPVLDNGGGPVSYTEGAGATQVTNTLTVSDADDTNLESATAEITASAETGDLLEWTDNNGADSIVLDVGNTTATKIALTGTGTLAQYEAALRAVTFRTTNDNPATSKTVSFVGNDGDANSAAEDVTISITRANDPPVADLNGTGTGGINTTATFSEPVIDGSGNPVTLAPNADALDPDDTTLDSAKVTLTNRPDSPAEALSATGTASITVGAYNPTTGELDLTTPSGEAPLSEWTTVLRSITYDNTAATPTDTDRIVTVTLNDGDADSSPASQVTIDIVPQNVAPTVDLNGTGTGGEDVNAAFTEGGGAVTLAPAADVADADDTTLASATVTITNLQDGAAESLTANVGATGITANYNSGTGVLTLSKSSPEASVQDYEDVLRTVAYNNTSDTPNTTSRSVTFTVNDGQATSTTRTATVSIDDTNDPPVNTVPGGQTLNEDSSKTFSSGNGNQISVSDADAGASPLQVTLTVTNGTLTLNGTTGLTFTPPADGTADQTMTFTGSQSDINAALNGMVYTPNSNYNGADTLQIVTNDQGATGGAAQSDTDNVGLTISAVNDGPTNTVPGAQSVDEDTALTFSSGNGNQVSTADPDSGASPIQVTLSVSNGALTLNGTTGLTFSFSDANGTGVGDGSGDATMTFRGSQTDVNNAMNGMTYQGTLNYNGPDTLSITTNDLGNTGGGALTDGPDNVAITVNPVNDAPSADAETFGGAGQENQEAHGNTTMQVDDPSDDKSAPTNPHTEIQGDILDGDTDVDGPGPLIVQSAGSDVGATNGQTADGGTVSIESDGDFVYQPPATVSCDNGSDSFNYKISDQANSGGGPIPGTAIGTVTIHLQGCVWYVNNNAAGNAGTSSQPFDTTQQAETASGANHTVFVFDGDNTSTGYQTGFAMNSGERLIGEHEGLTVDQDGSGGTFTADSLHPANAGAHPTLAGTNEDVVEIDDGNEVRGVTLDPAGTGSGLAGASGDINGGTFDDINVLDTAVAGSQPGIELDATTGTFNFSNIVVNNSAATSPPNTATGVRLNNAGTVNFNPTGQTSITTTGAKGLDAISTNMGSGSTFDDIIVSGSTAGGVNLSSASGTTTFGDGTGTDLSLTTSSGPTPAFGVANSGTVSVPSGGSAILNATGGPAVDVTGTSGPTLEFDRVSSTASANDGVNLDGLGTGTFDVTDGANSAIGNAAGISFDVNGGSGKVNYPGSLNDGGGTTAIRVMGRAGGTGVNGVTLSGPISDDNDAGGTLDLSSNTGGETTVSHATTKQFNTGGSDGISFTSSDGHTLTVTGGNLDVDTTAGDGVQATTAGTLTVTGNNNTINTGTGRGLVVQNTDFGALDVTFQSISTGAAPEGIDLENTGSAGNLLVQGDGDAVADGGGGSIVGTTSDGVQLDGTTAPVLNDLNITNAGRHGINVGDDVNVAGSTIDNTNISGAGDPNGAVEHGIRYEQTTGTHNLTGPGLISDSVHDNVRMEPTTGTRTFVMDDVDVNGAFPDGAHGVAINGAGTSVTTSTITNGKFDDHDGTGIQAFGAGDADMTTEINNNQVEDNESNNIDIGASETGDTRWHIHDNTLLRAGGQFFAANPASTMDSLLSAAIHVVGTSAPAAGSPANHGRIDNNVIGTNGVADSGSFGLGIFLEPRGDHDHRWEVTNNQIRHVNEEGIRTDVGTGDGDGNREEFDLHLHNNIVAALEDAPAIYFPSSQNHGMLIEAENPWDVCVDFTANQSADGGGTADTGNGYRTNQFNAPASPDGTSTFDIEDFAGDGTNEAQVGAHVTAQNTSGTGTANSTGVFGSPVAAGHCEHPTGIP